MSKLFAKLCKVMSSVGEVRKTGRNNAQNYSYATEADILEAVREALIEQGVFIFTSAEITDLRELVKKDDRGEKKSYLTTVKTTHTFVDSESGEQFSVYGAGQGHDMLDKSSYKAQTGAMKYFIMKNFLISTDDDPENDSKGSSGGSYDKSNTKPSFAPKKQAEDKPEPVKEAPAAPTNGTPKFGPAANAAKPQFPAKTSFNGGNGKPVTLTAPIPVDDVEF